MIKCSVIVPCYNAENTIERCINSIRESSLKEIEIIVINDGSIDNTLDICNEIKNQDNRVILIDKQNTGAGLSRNEGLKIAKGEYIAFVDSDDWIDDGFLEGMYSLCKKNDLDLSYAEHIRHFMDGSTEDRIFYYEKDFYCREEIKKEIYHNCVYFPTSEEKANAIFAVWVGMYKSSIIKDNNIQFVSERDYYSEDSLFNLMFLQYCKKVGLFRERLYHHEIGDNTLTTSTELQQKITNWYRYIKNISEKNNIEKYIIKWLNNTYLDFYKAELNNCLKLDKNKTDKLSLIEEKKHIYSDVKQLKITDFATKKIKSFVIAKLYDVIISKKIK